MSIDRAEALQQQRRDAQLSFLEAALACPLMPSEAHCWHEQLRLWDDPFPPPVVCCWCGGESVAVGAVPHRHGPYTTNVK